MNTFTLTNVVSERLAGPLLMATALVGLAVPALGCDELTGPSTLNVESLISMTQVSGDGEERIELSVRDGDIRVVINGQEIPAGRLKQEGDQIIVLDEDGKEVSRLNFRVSGGPGGFSYVLGDDAKRWQELGARLGRVYAEPSIVVAKPAKVMLGVNMTEPGPALERQLKLEPGATTMLSGVYDGLPAHEAGLAEYDIITAVNDQKPADPASIRKVLAAAEPDETIKLAVLSGGVSRNVDVKLVKHDGEAMRKARLLGAGAEAEELDPLQRTFSRWRGFQFQDANELPGQDVIVTPDAQMFRVPRVAPVPPIPPVAAGDANMQKQLDQVNERLRRLEQLLERLTIEKQQPR